MKKMFLVVSLLSIFVISLPALASDQMTMEKLDNSIMQLQQMRNKIETEKDPTTQKKLIPQHMQMMQDGMNMMNGQGSMMGQNNMSSGSTMDQMAMMENMMTMMENMMGQGMMTNTSGTPLRERMDVMGKKLMLMQETFNGMMMEQKMIKKE